MRENTSPVFTSVRVELTVVLLSTGKVHYTGLRCHMAQVQTPPLSLSSCTLLQLSEPPFLHLSNEKIICTYHNIGAWHTLRTQ